jgi:glycosyltransferase involved in cell wall biosynthesis
MPIFNDEVYLRLALDDLLGQSFADFELIISDNASTDASSAICRQYAEKDSRIRYVRQAKNIGAAQNFLFVLQEARAEFFMWAASDDRWHKDYVARLAAALCNDKGLSVAFAPFQSIDEEGRAIGPIRLIDCSGTSPFIRLLKFNLHLSRHTDAFWYGLFRRDLIKDLRFRRWRGINADVAINTSYPTLSFCLARGGYVSIGDQAMWLNRVYLRHKRGAAATANWSVVTQLFAFISRKASVALYSLEEIYYARHSRGLVLALLPVVVLRFIADILLGGAHRFQSLVRSKLWLGG